MGVISTNFAEMKNLQFLILLEILSVSAIPRQKVYYKWNILVHVEDANFFIKDVGGCEHLLLTVHWRNAVTNLDYPT